MTALLFGRAGCFTDRHQGATLAAVVLLAFVAEPLADLVARLVCGAP